MDLSGLLDPMRLWRQLVRIYQLDPMRPQVQKDRLGRDRLFRPEARVRRVDQ